MPKIEITNLIKAYGANTVLHDVSFTINDGEFVSLIGSSGCGKSTLLRTIAGLETASGGTIAMDGRVINKLPPKDRDIAMVFQNYALYPHLTVAQNMGFSLKLRKADKGVAQKAVADAAELLGLTPYLDRHPRALSGGQRQRVAMGRAIVRDPKIFLFDEPLSNLDAKLRVQMRLEIKTLQKRLGTTSIYVTHDQVEALTMSDRLVLLNQGRVEQIGSPSEVYHRPANVFVATFIGSPAMNLLSATYLIEADRPQVDISGVRLILDREVAVQSGQGVTVGLRPEHFSAAAAEGCNIMKVEAGISESTGAQTLVHGTHAGQAVSVVLPGDHAPASGSFLEMSVDAKCIHLFDVASGDRL